MNHYMLGRFDAPDFGRIGHDGMSVESNRIPAGGHCSCSSQDVVAVSILEDEAR